LEPARGVTSAFTPEALALAALCGALVGFLLALFGGGGSVLAAPLLLYAVGVDDPHVAIGTASAAVALNAALNLIGHARAGAVKWPCAIVFGASGLIGAFAGSTLAKAVDGRWLLLGFAAAMAAIAVSMLRTPRAAGDPDVHITPALMLRLTPMGAAVGFAAGFFGIGGGFLIVPGLMLAAGMTISNAAASSLVSVALFGASTATNYALSGLVVWELVAALVGGGAIGGGLGLIASRFLAGRETVLRRAFALMVFVVACYVAFKALGALDLI